MVITAGGGAQTFTVDYSGLVDGNPLAGLAASADFSFNNVNVSNANYDAWTLDTTIRNTSGGNVTASRISVLGFDLGSTLHSSLGVGGGIFNDVSSSNMPGLGTQDICFSAGSNCAGGGGNGVVFGIAPGGGKVLGPYSTTLTFRIAKGSNLSLNGFTVRYQSINYGNVQGDSGVGVGTIRPPVTVVPEPSAWMLMILGFGLIAQQLRRRHRAGTVAA